MNEVQGAVCERCDKPAIGYVSDGGYPERREYLCANHMVRDFTTGEWVDYYFAPPTPSQDAEGDGLARRVRTVTELGAVYHEWRVKFRDGGQTGVFVPEAIESAIRAPYEALVRDAVRTLTDFADYIGDAGGSGGPTLRAEASRLKAAVESLGGRKDG